MPEVVSKPVRPRDPIFIQKVINHLEDMENSEFRHYGVIKPAEDPHKQILQTALGDFKGAMNAELNKFKEDNSANNQAIQQSIQQIAVQKGGK